jgi:hypothetical protein
MFSDLESSGRESRAGRGECILPQPLSIATTKGCKRLAFNLSADINVESQERRETTIRRPVPEAIGFLNLLDHRNTIFQDRLPKSLSYTYGYGNSKLLGVSC